MNEIFIPIIVASRLSRGGGVGVIQFVFIKRQSSQGGGTNAVLDWNMKMSNYFTYNLFYK